MDYGSWKLFVTYEMRKDPARCRSELPLPTLAVVVGWLQPVPLQRFRIIITSPLVPKSVVLPELMVVETRNDAKPCIC